jgi:hypothetical protein
MEALKILPATADIQNASAGLFNRLFKEESPTQQLQARLLSRYFAGSLVNGTLLSVLVNFGQKPVDIIFNSPS